MHKYETRDMFYCNDFGSKGRLVMKFSHFMSYYKKKIFSKKSFKKCGLETSSKPFCIYNESRINSIGKRHF